VIPANAGEGLRKLQAPDHHVDAVAVEGRVNHVAQELPACWRVLRGLDHDPVAGGEHLDERPD
jgi:hypothetical protein